MAEMKPTNVPEALICTAVVAFDKHVIDKGGDVSDVGVVMRDVLTAVLPLHEQQMRERVAADIETWAEGIGWYEDGGVWADAIDVARTGRRHAECATSDGGDRG